MIPSGVEEVQTVLDLLYGYRVFLNAVLEDELLEEEESPFMRHLLANLDDGFPRVLGSQSRTVRTLTALHEVFDLEGLLEHCSREHL
jgi:hypothetical protein